MSVCEKHVFVDPGNVFRSQSGTHVDHLEKSCFPHPRLLFTALVPHEQRGHPDDRGCPEVNYELK